MHFKTPKLSKKGTYTLQPGLKVGKGYVQAKILTTLKSIRLLFCGFTLVSKVRIRQKIYFEKLEK